MAAVAILNLLLLQILVTFPFPATAGYTPAKLH